MKTTVLGLSLLAIGSPVMAQTAAPATDTRFRISTPVTFAPRQENEQGLGLMVQGGYVKATSFDVGTNGSFFGQEGSVTGYVLGVGFGGNKSATIGFGVDVNFVSTGGDLQFPLGFLPRTGSLDTKSLNVPVYLRFNFMGHATKEAPTAYALVGAALDFVLSAQFAGTDVKSQFSTFSPGILFGAGFEAHRIGVELRFIFSPNTLKENANGGHWNNLQDFRQLSMTILFKYRIR